MPSAASAFSAPVAWPARRRIWLAIAGSVALHAAALALNPRLPRLGAALLFAPVLSVTLTDLKSAPREARSELPAIGEGGGNTETPGHAESARLADEQSTHALSARSESRVRFAQGEALSLPTERKVATEGQRAPARGARQAKSEAAAGQAERGGDDCWIWGYRFCSPE